MSQTSNQPGYYPDLKVDRLVVAEKMTSQDAAIRNVFADITLDATLSGVQIKICKPGVKVTLPPTSIGYTYEIVNAYTEGISSFIIKPTISNIIVGGGITTAARGKELAMRNGRASSAITIVGDGTEGWVITKICAASTFAFV